MPKHRRLPAEALEWFSLALCAAVAGNCEAQAKLGDFYSGGFCTDAARARRWYQCAAEGGVTRAQRRLAELWDAGLGGEQDDFVAGQWWQLAARGGEPEAQWQLAACYAYGRGVPLNPREALRWLECAARNGHPDAAVQYAAAACLALANVGSTSALVRRLTWPSPQSGISAAGQDSSPGRELPE